jgi:hypothetical protein
LQKQMKWMLTTEVGKFMPDDGNLFGQGKICDRVRNRNHRAMYLPTKRADARIGQPNVDRTRCCSKIWDRVEQSVAQAGVSVCPPQDDGGSNCAYRADNKNRHRTDSPNPTASHADDLEKRSARRIG